MKGLYLLQEKVRVLGLITVFRGADFGEGGNGMAAPIVFSGSFRLKH